MHKHVVRAMNVFRLIGLYFKVNLASALEYRASFLLQAFGMALNNCSFVFFWYIAFSQIGGRIGGYDFNDVMFIWALCSSAFGASHILFANMNSITRIIVSGELDTFLLQPKDVLVSLLCSKTSLTAWGDFLYGFILMALTHGGDAQAWSMFLLGIVIGGLLMTAISVTAHTMTFYLGDASLIGSMALEFVINFCIYPEGIYRGVVRVLMLSVIPASFIVHIPLKLARHFSPGLLLLLLTVSAAYCCFAYVFFYRGLKRYESGNLIIARM
ncbi:MAG TPA: ABC-2 family transporter protein [Candidatus Atribacteria bacterium]|nr:ABC-2 family transporter protein [Candidatus Atribacteria bacterium]